jgi:metallophosphoesterase superfamily enzyme
MWQAHGKKNSCSIIANCIEMMHAKSQSSIIMVHIHPRVTLQDSGETTVFFLMPKLEAGHMGMKLTEQKGLRKFLVMNFMVIYCWNIVEYFF